ncbi:MAG: glycosyltransferase family 2 protein [Solirubrobacterales bacterium]|nr:glycosyltransferase family 2 protein [Solirubrobacterales bacterium]
MRISIIVNNHNYGRYVGEAIESALAQDHSDVEVIVVDDGSVDDSREVISTFDKKVVTVFKEQGGQSSAVNAGLERATGEAVMVLDADDRLRPSAARRVAELMGAYPEVVRIQFRMAVIDAGGALSGEHVPSFDVQMPSGDIRSLTLSSAFQLVYPPTSGHAFRTTALRQIAPIPTDYGPTGADWYLVHLTSLLGHVASCDDALGEYRIHGQNAYMRAENQTDIRQLQDSIKYQELTMRYMSSLARELGLGDGRMESATNSIFRVISIRFARETHPRAGDSLSAALAGTVRSTITRRDGIPLHRRALVPVWCAAVAAGPRPVARTLVRGEPFRVAVRD